MNNHDRRNIVSEKFKERFGTTPEMWSRAPGRVDLMGSHTDYNLGFVMTMTIDRDTWIAARPRSDRRVAITSLNVEGGGEFDLDRIEHDPIDRWTDYVRGMAKTMQEAGYVLTGFDGLVHSTVPFSSGLSSSAAIEMATGVMFQQLGGFTLDPVKLALLGQKAENHFVGVNSGILDQYSSAMGQAGCARLLDCKHLTSRAVRLSGNVQVVICDTRAKRTLAGTEYDERRAQCEAGVRVLQQWYPDITALRDVSLTQFEVHAGELPDVVVKRCRFIIEENQRVLDLAEALTHGDEARLQRLTAASYVGARDLYEIGAPAMAAMMQAMLSAPGVIGARQAGAGFGGCMVALVRQADVAAFAEYVTRSYNAATNIEPKVYAVQAAPGAGPL
ncbi:MAG TPA: galactokinase [Anaerolineae bacterium]|nr:galactokinase [Anaerolineae bacterium]